MSTSLDIHARVKAVTQTLRLWVPGMLLNPVLWQWGLRHTWKSVQMTQVCSAARTPQPTPSHGWTHSPESSLHPQRKWTKWDLCTYLKTAGKANSSLQSMQYWHVTINKITVNFGLRLLELFCYTDLWGYWNLGWLTDPGAECWDITQGHCTLFWLQHPWAELGPSKPQECHPHAAAATIPAFPGPQSPQEHPQPAACLSSRFMLSSIPELRLGSGRAERQSLMSQLPSPCASSISFRQLPVLPPLPLPAQPSHHTPNTAGAAGHLSLFHWNSEMPRGCHQAEPNPSHCSSSGCYSQQVAPRTHLQHPGWTLPASKTPLYGSSTCINQWNGFAVTAETSWAILFWRTEIFQVNQLKISSRREGSTSFHSSFPFKKPLAKH